MDVSTSLRRQKSAHPQPPVNICGAVCGTRVEVFGEELGTFGFLHANRIYDEARKAADLAIGMLAATLSRKDAQ